MIETLAVILLVVWLISLAIHLAGAVLHVLFVLFVLSALVAVVRRIANHR
jgi:hypothetical protein